MDPTTTSKIIDSLIDGYDADVRSWAVEIAKVCKIIYACRIVHIYEICLGCSAYSWTRITR